mgnify:FL=1
MAITVDYPRKRADSARAGNGNVFIAAGMTAAVGHIPGNSAGDLVGIDATVGYRLGEIPLLAIGARSVRTALVATGQALVDAIAIGLVGDDEHAGVGKGRGGAERERAGQKKGSHAAPIEGRKTVSRQIKAKG